MTPGMDWYGLKRKEARAAPGRQDTVGEGSQQRGRQAPRSEVRRRDEGTVVIVELAGEVDLAESGRFREALWPEVTRASRLPLVVDLCRVHYTDRYFWEVLLSAQRLLTSRGRSLEVRLGADTQPEQLARFLGLPDLLRLVAVA